MDESVTEHIYYQKGYDRGYADAMEYLAKKFDCQHKKTSNETSKESQEKIKELKDNEQSRK